MMVQRKPGPVPVRSPYTLWTWICFTTSKFASQNRQTAGKYVLKQFAVLRSALLRICKNRSKIHRFVRQPALHWKLRFIWKSL